LIYKYLSLVREYSKPSNPQSLYRQKVTARNHQLFALIPLPPPAPISFWAAALL